MVKINIQGLEVETERNITGLDPMNNALDNEAYLNQERSLRLDLLREYTKLQTLDVLLWDIFGNANKSHLQKALRVLTHFIENASCEEIVEAIDDYKDRLKSEGCVY